MFRWGRAGLNQHKKAIYWLLSESLTANGPGRRNDPYPLSLPHSSAHEKPCARSPCHRALKHSDTQRKIVDIGYPCWTLKRQVIELPSFAVLAFHWLLPCRPSSLPTKGGSSGRRKNYQYRNLMQIFHGFPFSQL